MTQELSAKDFQHLACALVAEFGKHRGRRPLARKGEIDAIHQVHIHSDAVDNRVYPLCNTVIARALLPMKRQQKHQQDNGIGIEDGGRVKQQSGTEQLQSMAKRQRSRIQRPVEHQKDGTTQSVSHIDHQQVPN